MVADDSWITPDWPAPANIHSCVTTREHGLSKSPFDQFNLGFHVGDDPMIIEAHRRILREKLGLSREPQWLQQVHGNVAIEARVSDSVPEADACYTTERGLPCAVLTADCLPVLFCSRDGKWVAAAHGGWRGLVNGILASTVSAFPADASQLMAWLGPAISVEHFEVGDDVREAVLSVNTVWQDVFHAGNEPHKWFADLYLLARHQLNALGITRIYGGDFCTFRELKRFYSYRRDGVTGRQASLIWIS